MVDDKQVRRSLWVGDLSVFESRLPYFYKKNKIIIIINITVPAVAPAKRNILSFGACLLATQQQQKLGARHFAYTKGSASSKEGRHKRYEAGQ